jgi:glycerophosphoryl diester phosphodiesterase
MEFFILIIWVFILIYVWYHPAKFSSQRPQRLAHRGLFSADLGIVENSIEAFQRAKEHGLGVELDVQLSSDNKLLVFHDASLMRLCQREGIVQDMVYDELKSLRLLNTESRICTFNEVIDLRLPYLMIEIKTSHRRRETVRAVLDALAQYPNPYSICSFDPRIVLEIKKQAPLVERGLIMESYLNNQSLSFLERLVLEFSLFSGVIRPHYVSFDIKHASFVRTLYRLLKWPSAVWTVRQQSHELLLSQYQTIIFEQESA